MLKLALAVHPYAGEGTAEPNKIIDLEVAVEAVNAVVFQKTNPD